MIDNTKFKKSIKNKYSFKDETFFGTPRQNPKDLIEVEIGDSKDPTKFQPQQKISRWNNECNVSIRLKDFNNFTVETEVEKIKLINHTKEVHIYQIEEGEGASEFEVILLEKPKTNVVEFTVQDKDVEYFYQPSLTEEEIEEGASRPDNIVGSYAIYAKEQKQNYVGGKEYKCGKVGHIFRPKIIDSVGREVWGTLHIENGMLSVTIPQYFLDNAVYPVIHAAGLTFGYGTAGGTSTSTNTPGGSLYRAPSENGAITQMSVYASAISGQDYNIATAIYSDNAGDINTFLAEDSGNTTVTSNGPEWYGVSISYSFTANLYYWLMRWYSAPGANYFYDAGSLQQYRADVSPPAFETWEDPFVDDFSQSRKLSIYATYTATEGVVPLRMMMGIGS